MKVMAQNIISVVSNLCGIPVSAVSELFKELTFTGIDKSGRLTEDCVPSGGLEGVHEAVLCHPLLAGPFHLLAEKFFCTGVTKFCQDRAFFYFPFIGTVFQANPDNTVKSLTEKCISNSGK